MTAQAECVLRARGIRRGFPGVRALDDVELCLRAGEIHALMGQNGAGKSTLIKVLTGVCPPDAGTIELEGRAIRPDSPLHAQQLGISTVYQEVNLCPNLTVAENIFAGRYPRTRFGTIDWRAVKQGARERLERLNLHIDPSQPLSACPVAVQQLVAIARALDVSARVLILDEPTSSLDEDEVRELFAVLRRLREDGIAILFVTHFLDQVYEISDRITVLRNGRLVGEYTPAELPHAALVAAMVGREVAIGGTAARRDSGAATIETPLLAARGIGRRGQVAATDLDPRRGEVLGLGGLLGSGRTELARLLFGLDRADSGSLRIDGEEVALRAPSDAIAHGLALCPEERKT